MLVDVGAPNLLGNLMNGVFRACDKECWRKRGGDACWSNEEVKEAILRKKDATR